MTTTMRRTWALAWALVGCGGVWEAQGQGFASGSSGAFGPLNVTANTTLDLPADGILHCTTIQVAAGAKLTFRRNALNTPAYLLATGDVEIAGTIDVAGGSAPGVLAVGGAGGPGGFDGGAPGVGGLPAGAGLGPGAGRAVEADQTPGAGTYGLAWEGMTPADGAVYGSPLLVPMLGGSGGGGYWRSSGGGSGGGGGGGALLIASSTAIRFVGSAGAIYANGGGSSGGGRQGSGGAVRLVAPVVSGLGAVLVTGVGGNFSPAGAGRVRVDTLDRRDLRVSVLPSASLSLGALMMVFRDPAPRLDLIEAAGTTVPEGTSSPVLVQLPFGSSPERTVTVQARDFGGAVPVRVVLTPENGNPVAYDATLDNAAANPATVAVNVTFPLNTVVRVHAWTR